MKTLTILLVFAITTGFGLKSISNDKTDSRIEVVFNRTLDFNDLVKIKHDLVEKGITIQYKLLKFDDNGGLEAIDFNVDCNDGFSGSAHSNKIFNNTKFGFYRDYDNSLSPFGTGALN